MPLVRPRRRAVSTWLVALGASTSAASLAALAWGQVSGTVLDQATQAPLAGVRVAVQASDQVVVTDASGAFTLPQAAGEVRVVAGQPGYFYDGEVVTAPVADLVLELEPVPVYDDPSYAFPPPSACAMCHPSQVTDWAASAMAHAGDNTWVYDTYDGSGTPGGLGGFVYTRDSAHAGANPASECRSCHQPEPWALEPYTALEPLATLSVESSHGVSCVVCHQMAWIDETKTNFPGLWPGVVQFQKPPADQPVMYGLLGDVDYQFTGQMRASYQPQLGAAACAACHQDKNDPDGDGDFEEDDGVVSEPTYQEWLESSYGDPGSADYATCADCHMLPTNAPSACVVLPGLARPPGQIRQHRFRGTTGEFLENAVSLALVASQDAGELVASVTVTNDKTGHHVPTGVTIRNAILVVEAVGPDGAPLAHLGQQVVHELGGVGDPAEGYFAGLPGKLFAKVNHDANGDGPTFFTDATGITFDTRIAAHASDVTEYRFAAPSAGVATIRARLVYRRSWRALVDAKGWTMDGHGEPLEDVAPPHFGHLMASAEQVVDLGGGGGGAGGGAPGGAGGGGEAGSGGGGGGAGGAPPGGAGGGGATSPAPSGSGCQCQLGPDDEPSAHSMGLAALVGLALFASRRPRGLRAASSSAR
jgi:MYXO-CTERM domain-containing protein